MNKVYTRDFSIFIIDYVSVHENCNFVDVFVHLPAIFVIVQKTFVMYKRKQSVKLGNIYSSLQNKSRKNESLFHRNVIFICIC